MSLRTRKIVTLLAMDAALAAELAYGFYSGFHGEDFSQSFLHAYLPVFLPTIIGFMWTLRRLNKKIAAEDEAAGREPENTAPQSVF
ncbi:hypothetical protein dsx2_3111 [Desulfovibrio sp. X2]|uniref:hypothetical protein n=1 Tax=Desulfovibrio sp. X2 TaxID=941449 RepID=UPI000358A81B|nr:hypothetical protein [Desulfovibrio sp. X2]EPR41592.1 hypothetical protein dsx2_3111 [Desulfovibrio sp. X2]